MHTNAPPPTPAPTQFGEWQLERSGNPPLFRVASSAETQLPGQWESAPRQSACGGPSQLDPHMLGGMWMLAKVTAIRGFKRKKKKLKIHSLPVHPFQMLLCRELRGSEWSQVGWGSCFPQRPLHKSETCLSLSLITMVSFSRAHTSPRCQIKCVFLRKWKSLLI